jgi:hypothetical protein
LLLMFMPISFNKTGMRFVLLEIQRSFKFAGVSIA